MNYEDNYLFHFFLYLLIYLSLTDYVYTLLQYQNANNNFSISNGHEFKWSSAENPEMSTFQLTRNFTTTEITALFILNALRDWNVAFVKDRKFKVSLNSEGISHKLAQFRCWNYLICLVAFSKSVLSHVSKKVMTFEPNRPERKLKEKQCKNETWIF